MINIVAARQDLLPLLTVQAPDFEVVLAWLQLYLTANWSGAYVITDKTTLERQAAEKGDLLLPHAMAVMRAWFTSPCYLAISSHVYPTNSPIPTSV